MWRYVDSLDLSPLYAKIQAVEGLPGRDAVDPKILMALWMFATIEGISSARQLDRLCERARGPPAGGIARRPERQGRWCSSGFLRHETGVLVSTQRGFNFFCE